MKQHSSSWQSPRRTELRPERRHDPYEATGKHAGPCACPDCGAVYQDGRWTWNAPAEGAGASMCPSCRRIRERMPAGYVTLTGPFFVAHRDEILAVVRHCEAREKAEHPLQRMMDIEAVGEGVCITTTDVHLARAIGEAVGHAFKGDLDYRYEDAENRLRVHWRR